MLKKLIAFDKVPQLAKTDLAYATGVEHLVPFYKYDLRQDVFHQIIKDKSTASIPRDTLTDVLLKQYENIPDSEATRELINLLRDDNTFTIVTAHQPCLFFGPLYFVYKAITAINLAEATQGIVGPGVKIIPVFVLGSEDHDINEVNHINLFNKKVTWMPEAGGPVGRISTADGIAEALLQLDQILGSTDTARNIYKIIERAYTGQKTFAAATQALLHALMGQYGLVVLNMDSPELKRHFIPIMEKELTEQMAVKLVSETADRLNELGYKTQATPREINLFYLTGTGRERIVKEGNSFQVLNTDLRFTQAEMVAHLHQFPERFSPNVVLRPLYQESILPNLAYVGGGGELAYWLERRSLFDHFGVNYPMLVRRNSVLWIDRDSSKKLERLGFTAEQFFKDTDSLVRKYVEDNASGTIDLTAEYARMDRIITNLSEKAAAIDPTLEKAALADGVKLRAVLDQWQARMMKAEKQKHDVVLTQLRTLKEKLFPAGGLQERHDSFLPVYLRYGERFFDILKERMLPLEHGFIVIEDV